MTANDNQKPQNPVAQLRERLRKIKDERKPSKEVEETFIRESEKKEEIKPKKIARTPEADV